ncbi:MAG TPA: tRNA pseudouridine(55) synthase TruB [Chloroflexia bacterium]|nr:tRNA pseudouridine(55) synthase TruB [Chloroflexia bacterium]
MDGIFNINKPHGLTSHDVVARVRRILRQWQTRETTDIQNPKSKVGHAGTLDPMATGVLPVVVGKATRLVEYLADADKAYRAGLFLGATSDTYDREGVITLTPEVIAPPCQAVEEALEAFRGEIDQLPPMHSAIKVGGKKLYELARKGVEIERQPRHVTITRLELEVYKPPVLQMFVECSKGTYIRSLAHDLGAALGTGAYLTALQRTRHGPFTIEGATTLEGLAAAFEEGTWQESLYPPDYILMGWRKHIVTPAEELDLLQGRPLRLPHIAMGEHPVMAAITQSGELLAILYWDGELRLWRPRKVFTKHNVADTKRAES